MKYLGTPTRQMTSITLEYLTSVSLMIFLLLHRFSYLFCFLPHIAGMGIFSYSAFSSVCNSRCMDLHLHLTTLSGAIYRIEEMGYIALLLYSLSVSYRKYWVFHLSMFRSDPSKQQRPFSGKG